MENRYLTIAEAAKEVSNKLGQYVDKSFIKMLCERKEISSSCIPARDARKNDVYMIHEGQIDKICLALRGEDQLVEVKKEEPMDTNTEKFDVLEPGVKYLSTAEAAECLGINRISVSNMISRGYIPAKKIKKEGQIGGLPYVYMIAENDVEDRMEHMAKKRRKREPSKSVDIPEPRKAEPVQEKVFPKEFYDRVDRMREDMAKMRAQLDTAVIKANAALENRATKQPEIDIAQIRMEAYKEGFKEGFKAAMEVK